MYSLLQVLINWKQIITFLQRVLLLTEGNFYGTVMNFAIRKKVTEFIVFKSSSTVKF